MTQNYHRQTTRSKRHGIDFPTLTRLFQADFHAVLDRIEEPDLQLARPCAKCSSRSTRTGSGCNCCSTNRELAASAESKPRSKASTRSSTCLAAKKDDLARDLVRRKLAAEKQAQDAERRRNPRQAAPGAGRRIDEQQQQLDRMKQKLELLVGDEDDFGAAARTARRRHPRRGNRNRAAARKRAEGMKIMKTPGIIDGIIVAC